MPIPRPWSPSYGVGVSRFAPIVILTLACPAVAFAQAPADDGEGYVEGDEPVEEPTYGDEDVPEFTVTTTGIRPSDPGRATSAVTREEIDQRLPRSAPDAIRYEAGVYVQQTAHSQGSPYIRGRTGQQTVLLFDDVRLNNSLFRMGPNQYFFTIDSRSISHIEVLRGSASTRYGSDAISGVIHAHPLQPGLLGQGLTLKPRIDLRYASADNEVGGRGQLDAQWDGRIGVLGGVGYRQVGMLESGGIVRGLTQDEIPEVPRFLPDRRTQLGTGFDELTADARLVYRLGENSSATLAYYDYRQFDAPRTDQCPPPEAPFDECLLYEEQFRTLVYGAVEGAPGALMEDAKLTLSWQRQHERRRRERPGSFSINGGRDDTDTFGVAARASTAAWSLGDGYSLAARYGADAYHDRVESVAWIIFEDAGFVGLRSRGQYIDDSTYTWGGVWSEAEAILADRFVLRAGGRLAHTAASAPEDIESGTMAVDQGWQAVVGNAGAEWWVTDDVTVLVSADQGFRAPNLDDLTSRQQTGPGFQFENANLGPERSLTLETGLKLEGDTLELAGWLYTSNLEDAITRSPRFDGDCPPSTPQCDNSRSRFQLVNADGESVIHGAELTARIYLPWRLTARATIAYAWGEGPNPGDPPQDPSVAFDERVPLSRIAPLNGTAELLWRRGDGLYFGGALRWADRQDRLALADISDARIPRGGTPGFAVFDLRAGYRMYPHLLVSFVFENLTDAAYRYHGSSINGAGRGFLLNLQAGL